VAGTAAWDESSEKAMEEREREQTGKSTGPKTPEGKESSSRNATKHGCRSKRALILPDETQEEYDELRNGWMAEFEPEGHQERRLVEKLILNDWLQQRAERWLLEVEARVVEETADATDWSGEQHHKVELMQRYKTTAERAFYRSWNAVQSLRKDFMREQRDMHNLRTENVELHSKLGHAEGKCERTEERLASVEKQAKREEADAKTPAQQIFQGQNSKKKQGRLPVLEQWVEVKVVDGKTVTELTPSNEGLIKRGKEMHPPPVLVYRRLHFMHGVPIEYDWAAPTPEMRRWGGGGLQRMTVDTWLELIEREKEYEGGHIGPTGVGNLPRPKAHGVCECAVCREGDEEGDEVAEADGEVAGDEGGRLASAENHDVTHCTISKGDPR